MKTLIITALLAFSLVASISAKDLLINGDFASGSLSPWKHWTAKEFSQPEITIEGGVLHYSRDEKTKHPYHSALMQAVTLTTGKTYTLSFDMKGAVATSSKVTAVIAPRKPAHDYDKAVELKLIPPADWEPFKVDFIARDIVGEGPVSLKFQLGHIAGDLYLRNIQLIEQ